MEGILIHNPSNSILGWAILNDGHYSLSKSEDGKTEILCVLGVDLSEKADELLKSMHHPPLCDWYMYLPDLKKAEFFSRALTSFTVPSEKIAELDMPKAKEMRLKAKSTTFVYDVSDDAFREWWRGDKGQAAEKYANDLVVE
jgi:hypothetical protein